MFPETLSKILSFIIIFLMSSSAATDMVADACCPVQASPLRLSGLSTVAPAV
jgi:hypothetical protein